MKPIACLVPVLILLFQAPAWSQPTYSIDYQGPTKGLPDFAGIPITEGDLMGPGFIAPPAIPTITVFAGGAGFPSLALPLYPGAVGVPAGFPGFVEVDAFSYGVDPFLDMGTPNAGWHFSVDTFSVGVPPPLPLAPNVTSEGALGAAEAAADIFSTFPAFPFPPGPLAIGASPPANTLVYDGGGPLPGGYPQLGLVEPAPPVFGAGAAGDNLDALDLDTPPTAAVSLYFSLDSAFFDATEGIFNTGSAAANGLGSGSDVFAIPPGGGAPAIYAPAFLLGLDLGGFDTDDIDALVLWENGDGIFTPSMAPYDWVTAGTDMIFFSVRRGSMVIGMFDSFFGIPIEEGDILFPNGGAGTPPGIWIAAENLGLCTARTCPFTPSGLGDDLNALDLILNPVQRFQRGDCNADGTTDISDPITALMFLFLGGAPLPCDDACDGNDDGALGITDVLFLLNYLFVPLSPPPPLPFPACGLDTTIDPLGCASFPPCP